MDPAFRLSSTAVVIWWTTLILTLLVFVPLAWRLLHRTWRAAAQIRDYTERALDSGLGIAGNTAALTELETTLVTVGEMVGTGEETASSVGRLRGVLLERAGEGRP